MQSSWSTAVGTLIHDSLAILQGVDILRDCTFCRQNSTNLYLRLNSPVPLTLSGAPAVLEDLKATARWCGPFSTHGRVSPCCGNHRPQSPVPLRHVHLPVRSPEVNHNNFFVLRWSRAPQSRMNNQKGSPSFRLLQTCACAKMHNLWIWDGRGCSRTHLSALDLRVCFTCHLYISVRGDVCCRQG